MLKTTKLYALLAIIIASTAVSLFSFPQTALADQFDTIGFDDKRVLEDANVITYAQIVSRCLDGTSEDGSDGGDVGDRDPTQDDIVSGDWFTNIPNDGQGSDFYKYDVGYAAQHNGGDGVISCNDDEVTLGSYFTTLGGWESRIEAACAVTFRIDGRGEDTQSECVDLSDSDGGDSYRSRSIPERGNNPEAYASLIRAMPKGELNTGGYGENGYSDEQLYLLYKTALLSPEACGASLHGLIEGNTNPDNGNYDTISLINMAGERNDVYIDIPNNDEVTVAYGLPAQNCEELIGLMDGVSGQYIDWLGRSNPQASDSATIADGFSDDGGESNSTCRVDGVGWFVCPIVNLMAGIADDAYYLLDNSLLRVEPVEVGNTEDPLYKSWKMTRDFANVAFVIAFLIIIFSQITSIGISNYGIKRLLPKIVIAAILVNISYYICAIAVDLSNILGNSLKGMLDGAAGRVDANPTNPFAEGGGVSGFVGWVAISSGILIAVGASGGWLAALALLVPLLFTVLGAIIAVVITLILRQVLIILLIVISPLAFVALLLPNTEDYFKKWRSVFQSLLILYPIIALVFGASALASTIIMGAAGTSTGDAVGEEALGGIAQTMIQLTGAAAAVIPLFIVPTLVKLSGGVLNRFAGVVNDPSKGWIDNKRNAAKDRGQILKARGVQRQAGSINDPNRNILGVPGSRGRRVFGAITAYGINNRARARKEDLKTAESTFEAAFQESTRGQRALNDSKEAQVNLQTAQLNAESVSINALPAELLAQAEAAKADKETYDKEATSRGLNQLAASGAGSDVWTRAKDAANREQVAKSNANALGFAGADRVIAAQAETARNIEKGNENELTREMTPLVSQASRTYLATTELTKKAAEDIENATATDNVDHTILGQAEDAKLIKEMSDDGAKIAGNINATKELKMQAKQTSEYLGNVELGDTRDYEATVAGAPPAGVSAATAAAARYTRESSKVIAGEIESEKTVSDGNFTEKVINNPSVSAAMAGSDPNGALRQRSRAAASQSRAHKDIVDNHIALLEHEGTASSTLLTNAQNTGLPAEEQEANAILLTRNGGDKQIDEFYDYVVSMPASDLKVTLQQQFAANVGSRKSAAIGETDMDLMRQGIQTTKIEDGWIKRARKLSGPGLHGLSNDRLESFDKAIKAYASTPSKRTATKDAELKKIVNSINDYRVSPQYQPPPEEIEDWINTIETDLNAL